MKWNKTGKHVKGYTLSEVLVTMAISSMVVITGLYLYFLVFRQSAVMNSGSDELLQSCQLVAVIQNQFESSKYIWIEDNVLYFRCGESLKSMHFSDQYAIFQTGGIADTLVDKIEYIDAFFRNIQVDAGYIDAIWIQLYQNGKAYNIKLRKDYDAFTLLKLKAGNFEGHNFE